MASPGTPVFPGTQVEKPCLYEGGDLRVEQKRRRRGNEFQIIGAANETNGDHFMNKFQVSKDRISQPVFRGNLPGQHTI